MATKRRGHGEGSVFYDSRRQRWIAMLDLGRDGSGKRHRVWRSATSKADAAALLRDLQATHDRGDDPRGVRRTVTDVLEDFRKHGIDPRRAASTRAKTLLYTTRFAEAMRSRPLRDVTVRHVEAWLTKLNEEGTGKAHRTLVEARGSVAQLIDHAIRLGWLPSDRNPARFARIPEAKASTPRRAVLDDAQVAELLRAVQDDWWYPLLAFVAVTGVRVGEAAGLAWSDVDTTSGLVFVQRAVRIEPNGALTLTTPKANSARRIALPAELIEVLKRHRAQVAEQALARGESAPDLAFPTTSGTVADPHNLRRWLRGVAKQAGVPITGFHALRHSAASSLANTGSAPIHVAALLGHATPRTTLGVYTHPVAPHADAGLARGARLLSGSKT